MKKLVLIVLLFVACGAAVWLGTRYKPTPAGREEPPTNAGSGDVVAPPTTGTTLTSRVFRHHQRPTTEETDPMDIWDKKVDAIIKSPATDAEIADKLLQLYPQMPTNGQADLFVEITPRVSNENYNKLSGVLTNSTTPGDVLDVLLTDLIDRPGNVRMPALLELARNKDNPKSEDAHDLLEVTLGDDYGDDWDQWSKKISEWIASHPDE